MRAFLCIPIPDQLRATIHRTAEGLRSKTRMRANWVPWKNYHITLRFLGDIDPGLSVRLDKLCRDICCDISPFDCSLDRVGAFPNVDRAQVIWIGGAAPSSLQQLSLALSAGLADLDFPETREEDQVHVTLARIKDRPDSELPSLIANLNPIGPLQMTADRVVLMESTLSSRGAEYSPLFTTKLGKA